MDRRLIGKSLTFDVNLWKFEPSRSINKRKYIYKLYHHTIGQDNLDFRTNLVSHREANLGLIR